MVFVVLFTLTLTNEEDERAFLEAFRKLSEKVRLHEPGALTYELHHELDEQKQPKPFHYIVVERYVDDYSLEEVHNKNPYLAELVAVLGKMNEGGANRATFTLHQYENSTAERSLQQLPALTLESVPPVNNPLLEKGVLVLGGGRVGVHADYVEEATRLGELIATQEKRPLVYGAGTGGVMGAAVKACIAKNGTVISVIPTDLHPPEELGAVVYHTDTMSEKKSIMFAHSDTMVGLPGGVGTFDELIEVIALFQSGCYRPKIGLLNVHGFFDAFLNFLKCLIRDGFLDESVFSIMVIKDTAEELLTALKEFVPPPPSNKLVWTHKP
ncbi:Antibiotic biosynthesis monooxygenase/SLOG cluster4 family/Possible lysine decarboxylase, putative [Angomonas deanei]|uniref:Antibiotic biosynthesis monooxygenase/SLOG cluster4 family/Possible lysine decarboxylase, putative n=1 Tax=Angomonas deanei TaxID=59799 RepID=A0A7G2CTB7_9TRYP|nr:Antibiotic biosynthesis monooxygenase/SLOG cluster4 family/Possible lysine decarboxylase, putative [Angomonas deanei]